MLEKVKEQKEFKKPPPKPCRNFLAGKCQNGSKCKFLHDSSAIPASNIDTNKGDNKANANSKTKDVSSSSSSRFNNAGDINNNNNNSNNGFIYFDKFIPKSTKTSSKKTNNEKTTTTTEVFIPHKSMISFSDSLKSGQVITDDDCITALIKTLKDVIENSDNDSDHNNDYDSDMNNFIKNHLDFISPSIIMSVGMQSFMDGLLKIIRTSSSKKDHEKEAIKTLKGKIEVYLTSFQEMRIDHSRKQIGNYLKSLIKIYDNTTTVAVYGHSTLVLDALKIFIEEQEEQIKKNLRIIVIDSRPLRLGMSLAHSLVEGLGLHCTYTPLAGCSMHLKSCDYVLLGSSGLTPIGASTSVGTASVASMATAVGVPVILLCETYKITKATLWDAFSWNSLGSGEELVTSPNTASISSSGSSSSDKDKDSKQKKSQSIKTDGKSDDKKILVTTKAGTFKGPVVATATTKSEVSNLRVINPRYDFTPIELLSFVVTEMGLIGSSSNSNSSNSSSGGISSQILQLSNALFKSNKELV